MDHSSKKFCCCDESLKRLRRKYNILSQLLDNCLSKMYLFFLLFKLVFIIDLSSAKDLENENFVNADNAFVIVFHFIW